MWNNAEVARCVREGDVLVTEDGKIFQISNISNQDKVSPDSYGQVATLMGKMDGDTITVGAAR